MHTCLPGKLHRFDYAPFFNPTSVMLVGFLLRFLLLFHLVEAFPYVVPSVDDVLHGA